MTFPRVVVALVLVVSGIVAFYGLILDRSGQNTVFVVAGLAVFGLALVFVAIWLFSRALNDARWGRAGRALTASLVGGIVAVGAAMALAAGSVFFILTLLT